MTAGERRLWERFKRMLETAARGGADGCVPIAAILLPSGPEDGEGMDIQRGATARILWPSELPVEARTAILHRAARSYETGTVQLDHDERKRG